MFPNKLSTIFALAFLGICNAEVISPGSCPKGVQVMPNFNVEKYLGSWYEFAKYPSFFERGGKCNTAFYSLQADGNVGVYNTMIDENSGEFSDISGFAVQTENAKLKVTFPVSPLFNSTSNYWVLDTDYTSFSTVYSCQQVGIVHATYAWILTREQFPSEDTVDNAKNAFTRNGIPLNKLEQTNQVDCN